MPSLVPDAPAGEPPGHDNTAPALDAKGKEAGKHSFDLMRMK